jgi:hypothetical protein
VKQASLARVLVREGAVQINVGGRAEPKRVQDRRVGALDQSRAGQLQGHARFTHGVVVGHGRRRHARVGPVPRDALAVPRPAV